MLQFVIAGLVIGGIYALSAAGIVMTYVSTGILNFAFASLAFFVARFYYFLLVQEHWSIAAAAIVSIGLCGPAMGIFLYLVLFQFLRQSSTLVKVVATVGLSVALPPIAITLFQNITILTAPGLSPLPVPIFHVDGVAINANQLITYIAVVVVFVIGVGILKFTEAGLRVRAVVDSEAMTSLSGTNPSAVTLGVWASSIFLAGLVGVLAAPVVSLNPESFQLIVAAAFAAVVAARLRNLGVAVVVGFAMGIAGSVAQWALPPASTLIQVVIPSIPFIFIVLFLAYNLVRYGSVTELGRVGGVLDQAIKVEGGHAAAALAGDTSGSRNPLKSPGNIGTFCAVGAVLVLPLVLPSFWANQVGELTAIAVVFLSIVLVTGEGGMLWLCQITFAGVGALTTAQLATNHGWPILLAMLVGGLAAGVMGTLIGLATIRLGDLYVALVTFTFALLMSTLVFTRPLFYQGGLGVSVNFPSFASTPTAFAMMGVVVFCVLGLIVYNVRRSTTGLALSAIRSSPTGARSIGLSVVRMKLLVATLAAVIAGIGGGLLAIQAQAAQPDTFNVFTGLVWLAVLVPIGIRSNAAALVAAALYVYLPAIFLNYLPASWAQVPTALFGLGAVMVARNPHGVLEMNARQASRLVQRVRKNAPADVPTTPTSEPAVAPLLSSSVMPSAVPNLGDGR